MEIRLEKVKAEEKEILHRLLQYSLYEESGTDQNEMGDDGLFEYQWFDCYFEQQDKMQRDAYFIREQETGKLGGTAFLWERESVSVLDERDRGVYGRGMQV